MKHSRMGYSFTLFPFETIGPMTHEIWLMRYDSWNMTSFQLGTLKFKNVKNCWYACCNLFSPHYFLNIIKISGIGRALSSIVRFQILILFFIINFQNLVVQQWTISCVDWHRKTILILPKLNHHKFQMIDSILKNHWFSLFKRLKR